MINDFSGEYAFLSNFYPAPVFYRGILYQSSEAAYQAQKEIDPERRVLYAKVTPSKAKRMGRKANLRPDWNNVRGPIMAEIVHAKFKAHPDLMAKLVATYPRALEEGNTWHDNYFGNCYCPRCAGVRGENVLGKILMREIWLQMGCPSFGVPKEDDEKCSK